MSSAISHPVDLEFAAERARLLIGCYRRDDVADPQVFGRAIVAVLMRYPEEVVVSVTEPATGLPSRLKWLPSIAEIVDACDARMEPILRRCERERLDEERRRALCAPMQPKQTKEELAAKYPGLFPKKDAPAGQRASGFRTLAEIAAEAGVTQEQIAALPNAPARA
jgi:hypothetical protein